MQFEFDLRIGNRVIRICDTADTHAEFFEKMAFYDTIPPAGPNGEAELKFTYRTPKGYAYYSIACPDAGMEFMFGQFKEAKGTLPKGSFFPKSWERILYGAESHDDEEELQRAADSPRNGAKEQETEKLTRETPAALAGDPNRSDGVNLDVRAEWFVTQGRVIKTEGGKYAVKVNEKITYAIWRNDKGRVLCECERFKKHVAEDATFRCEHIRAVALKFGKPQPVVA